MNRTTQTFDPTTLISTRTREPGLNFRYPVYPVNTFWSVTLQTYTLNYLKCGGLW